MPVLCDTFGGPSMRDTAVEQLAEQLRAVMRRASEDEAYRNALLGDPASLTRELNLDAFGYTEPAVEYHEGYGLFITLRRAHVPAAAAEASPPADSFHAPHFLECHRH
jgi:hypothetical protein